MKFPKVFIPFMATIFLIFLAGAAFATNCNGELANLDVENNLVFFIPSPVGIDPSVVTKALALYEQASTLCQEGKNTESLELISQIKSLLGIK